MTGQELKDRILELSKPVLDFCREQNIVSALLPTSDDGKEEFEIQIRTGGKLPPHMKNVHSSFGSIYQEVKS